MLTHLAAALGVLGLLTIVPGPDVAVVTRRALVAGPRSPGWAPTSSSSPKPGASSRCRGPGRALGRTTGVVLIGFALATSAG